MEESHQQEHQGSDESAKDDTDDEPEFIPQDLNADFYSVFTSALQMCIRAHYWVKNMDHQARVDAFMICFDECALKKFRNGAHAREIAEYTFLKELKNQCSKLILSITKLPHFHTFLNMPARRLNAIPKFDAMGNYLI